MAFLHVRHRWRRPEFERGRLERMRRAKPRLHRAQLDALPVRALRSLLAAVGETDRGCIERSELIAIIEASARIEVVAAAVGRI